MVLCRDERRRRRQSRPPRTLPACSPSCGFQVVLACRSGVVVRHGAGGNRVQDRHPRSIDRPNGKVERSVCIRSGPICAHRGGSSVEIGCLLIHPRLCLVALCRNVCLYLSPLAALVPGSCIGVLLCSLSAVLR
jgi:hypothetical protein